MRRVGYLLLASSGGLRESSFVAPYHGMTWFELERDTSKSSSAVGGAGAVNV